MGTYLTPTLILRRAVMIAKNMKPMLSTVHRDIAKDFKGSLKTGGTATIYKPPKWTAGTTADITSTTQTYTENSTSISVATRRNVAWSWSSQELTLTIDEYSKKYLESQVEVLMSQVEKSLTGLYADVANSVGSPGVTPADYSALSQARQKLSESGVSFDGNVSGILNPAARGTLAGEFYKLVNNQTITEELFRRGMLGTVDGIKWHEGQLVRTHTNGSRTGSGTGTGTVATSTTITPSGFTGGVIAGEVFTIADVYAVNPSTGDSTGSLMQFTVATTDTDISTGTMTFTPAIVVSGAGKNVTGASADYAAVTDISSKVITFSGAASTGYPQNLVYHKNAFALAFVPLVVPDSAQWGATVTEDGFSIRLMKGMDIKTDEEIVRMDILYGVKTIYPEFACRIWG